MSLETGSKFESSCLFEGQGKRLSWGMVKERARGQVAGKTMENIVSAWRERNSWLSIAKVGEENCNWLWVRSSCFCTLHPLKWTTLRWSCHPRKCTPSQTQLLIGCTADTHLLPHLLIYKNKSPTFNLWWNLSMYLQLSASTAELERERLPNLSHSWYASFTIGASIFVSISV